MVALDSPPFVQRDEMLSSRHNTVADAANTDFDAIYEAYAEFVWRNARRLGGPWIAVDDVVQDVFLVIHRKLGELRSTQSIRAWIFSILVRTLHSHKRTQRRRAPHLRATGPLVSPETVPDSERRSPFAQAEQSDAVRLLRELLDELDSNKRTVFLLAELEEMTVPEISEALGVNENTIYSRLRAARREFEQAVAKRTARDERRPR